MSAADPGQTGEIEKRPTHELAPRPEGELAGPLPYDSPVDERGELRPFEVLYRTGLLLGALLFFREALGFPWERGFFGIAGFLLTAIMVMTLVFNWRALGDWRRRTQQWLYIALTLTLSIPVAAALNPALGESVLPALVEGALLELVRSIEAIPGMGIALALFRGILSFFFLLLTLVILVFGSGRNRRAGVLLVAIVLTAICLLFYPSAETIAGFAFLGLFVYTQWETPLLVPDRLKRHLRPAQLDFLRELVRQGSLTTGETKLYLENDPRYFAELMDFRLVDFDPVARDVLPGHRLLHDPASDAMETGFTVVRRSAWLGFGVLYVLSPVTLVPGPIDDLIVFVICLINGTNLFAYLRPQSRIRR